MSNTEKKIIALMMADRLEFLANGLDKAGMHEEATINRAKAASIRKANP